MRHQPGQTNHGADAAAAAAGAPDHPHLEPCVAGSSMAAELAADVDWRWLAGLRRSQRHGPVLRVDLEAGSAGGVLPARYECRDTLLAQVAGRRRVLLLSPEHAFQGLYPYPGAPPSHRAHPPPASMGRWVAGGARV